MPLRLPEKCPRCGLILLFGHLFDAFDKEEEYGPILRLHRDVNPEEAKAGYVGIDSVWRADNPGWRDLYRCPRCNSDPLIEVVE